MDAITIPKKITKKGDLVIVPRKEYEALLEFKKIKEFSPTKVQRKSLLLAERNLKRGKTVSGNEFARTLGFTD